MYNDELKDFSKDCNLIITQFNELIAKYKIENPKDSILFIFAEDKLTIRFDENIVSS